MELATADGQGRCDRWRYRWALPRRLFIWMRCRAGRLKGTRIYLGAQDVYFEKSGALHR